MTYSFLDKTRQDKPTWGKRLYLLVITLGWVLAFFWAFKGVSLAYMGFDQFTTMMAPLVDGPGLPGLRAILGGVDPLTAVLADLVYPIVAQPQGVLD